MSAQTPRKQRLSAPLLARIRNRLLFLYGQNQGEEAFLRLERMLEAFQRPAGVFSGGFDEKDVLLITYGDTLASAAESGLAALARFCERRLGDLISAVHVLPFYPYSSDYGFSVVDYLSVNPELGTWSDVGNLRTRFKLMFDFVLNHVSARSEWFQAFLRGDERFCDFFICTDLQRDYSSVTRPRSSPLLTPFETSWGRRWVWTTFSADQIDLNYRNPDVLLAMLDVMLRYVELGADLLRMDAVGYLWKEVGTSCTNLPQAHEIVKLFRDVLDAVAPHVAIVTETNVPHRENVGYFGDGRDEAQMVYQFALPVLVLDAFAREDARHLQDWTGSLNLPSETTAFFNFLASHDGIGVIPATGILSQHEVDALVERVLAHGGEVSYKTNHDGRDGVYELNITYYDALSSPHSSERRERKRDRFLCSQAIMLALRGVPGLYIHSLFGSHNDTRRFLETGWKRDLNHGKLDLSWLEGELDDGQSEVAGVFAGYARLLRVRRAQAAFHPASPQRILPTGASVFGFQRGPHKGQIVVALHNVSSEVQGVDAAVLPDVGAGYRDLLNGALYGSSQPITLAPYQVVWLVPQDAVR